MARRQPIELDAEAGRELLQAVQGRLRVSQPLADALVEDIEEGSRQQFANGKGWARLTPAYKRRKARDGKGSSLLIRTGALRRSLIDPHARGAVVKVNTDSVTRGTTLKQAVMQKQGNSSMKKRDPLKQPRNSLLDRTSRSLIRHLEGQGGRRVL